MDWSTAQVAFEWDGSWRDIDVLLAHTAPGGTTGLPLTRAHLYAQPEAGDGHGT
jgi:hypothetical protein